MRDGFVKVAAVTPEVRVADVAFNVGQLVAAACEAASAGAKVIVTPELAVTGYTCEDLFWQDTLIDAAYAGVLELAERTAALDALLLVGAPLAVGARLYNCAFALSHGRVLGVVPKRHIPNYNEFYEARHFAAGPLGVTYIHMGEPARTGTGGRSGADTGEQEPIPFGANQLFVCDTLPELVVAAEICEDLWAPCPPSITHALAGATVVCNLSASNAVVGKAAYRRDLVRGQSARLVCGYVYASAGWGESTTDAVYAGHNLVAENGVLLAEAAPFSGESAVSEVDVRALAGERRRMSTFGADGMGLAAGFAPAVPGVPAATVATVPGAPGAVAGHVVVSFSLEVVPTTLTRAIDAHPFVPAAADERAARCEDVFAIQSWGLAKRLAHTGVRRVVVGVSGGLDSTLALLVSVRAFDLLGLSRTGIVAITMPGFGTTGRTRGNARGLAEALGVTLREVSIAAAVRQHFADIGHDEAMHDVTYENAQARERTQIIMDVANQEGGLVVGTGDLSELVLGWATYNGDHMSMYGVNAGVPKTLVRHLVRYVADTCGNVVEAAVLADVLDTPVSPELLPADADGRIAQRTEDLVGPYELHDFFLYQVLRRGFAPRKVFRLARLAFADTYDEATVATWLRTFYRRFFAQQFKRSCLPDGPKVGSVAVSPRGDLRMPSDAVVALWLRELEEL